MATPEACILIRDKPHYRRSAFVEGAIVAGYRVTTDPNPKPGNILVIWNRYAQYNTYANEYEKACAKVIVVENGYLGNDFDGGVYYTCSLNRHNVGSLIRRRKHWFDLHAYRSGSEVIVLPQRGIGQEGVKMPRDWLSRTEAHLKKHGVEYRIRAHPGVHDCIPLQDDLRNAKCVITWGSGAALKAMMWGIPVLSDFRDWIGFSASTFLYSADFDNIQFKPRDAVFDLVASSIFNLDEIKQGVIYE